jgi:DNA mismatch endonuclease (patch repair protein)
MSTISPMSERPKPTSILVSTQMSRMPRSSTGPELTLRRHLHQAGVRYRVNYRAVPGSPDIAFTKARIACFVDGCFWHNCPEHGNVPKTNSEWWTTKFAVNRARDRRKDEELLAIGWLPVHIWEHEPPDAAADRLIALWRERTGRVERSAARPLRRGILVVPDEQG